MAPLEARVYGIDPCWTFRYENNDDVWTAYGVKTYSFGSEETYIMSPVGRSIYTFTDADGRVAAQMSVTPDRSALLISEGGYTKSYQIQEEIPQENVDSGMDAQDGYGPDTGSDNNYAEETFGTDTQDGYEKAAEWFIKASEAGIVGAMNRLGVMYDQGTGVVQDEEKAIEWYTKAAEAGNDKAMDNLGNMYKDGTGVVQDYVKALECFTIVSEGDNSDLADIEDVIQSVQGTLNILGYDCGTPDGIMGDKTRIAVRSFRSSYGLKESEEIDLELMRKLIEIAGSS